jgi:hypothetical protein
MAENGLRVTNKELFYSAMLLGLDRLVGVEYVSPAANTKLNNELDEVKRTLHRKKLLKESAKGEITLDFMLSVCATFCARPVNCLVVDKDGFYATIYNVANLYMLLERLTEDESEARLFMDRESMNGYIAQKLELAATKIGTNV